MDDIAIDLHVRSSMVREVTSKGKVREYEVLTERETLKEAFGHRPAARILLESSTDSEWVAQLLEQWGHQVIVVDPNFEAMYATRNPKIKTNLRDARALSDALRKGDFRPAYRLTAHEREVRQRLLGRMGLVRSRCRLISATRSICRQEGIRIRSCKTNKFASRVRERELPAGLLKRIERSLRAIELLDELIELDDQELAEEGKADRRVGLLQSHPQVGPITALAYVSVMGDPARFGNCEQVSCYQGLVPQEESSSDYHHRGRITKQGNTMLRWLLVEAGWGLLRSKDKDAAALRQWGTKIANRRGKPKAAVALARKVGSTLWAMDRDQAFFRPRGA